MRPQLKKSGSTFAALTQEAFPLFILLRSLSVSGTG